MQRRAYFFKVSATETVVEHGQNVDKEINLLPIFQSTLHRKPLPNHTDSNAILFLGNYISLSNIPKASTDGEIYGQFYHLKKKIIAMKDDGTFDVITEQSLGGTDHQAEIANFVYFPQKNCIGLEYNHFMPRYHVFASYLQQIAVAFLRREIRIQLSFIRRNDPVAEINRGGAVSRLDIGIYAGAATALAGRNFLTDAIRQAAAPLDTQVKLTLGYQRGDRHRGATIPFSKTDIAEAWQGAEDIFEIFSANIETASGMRSVNFIDDYARAIWDVRATGNIVSSDDIFVKIRDHYINSVDSVV
jgi:hypothetical protein